MKALITGAGGFLGGAILRQWLAKGHTARSYSRSTYPDLQALRVEQLQGDLADAEKLQHAIQGCEIVFHVAAKAGVWGSHAEYVNINVLGTSNVITGCLAAGVRHLVYTSSPSVTFDGRDQECVNESVPYPKKFLANYPWTKAMAEESVLKSNGKALNTVALRPHLIWGPGDNHLIPRLIERARLGKLRLIRNGGKLVDTTYIENAAEAHILAAEKLITNGQKAACAGKAYFISNGEPQTMDQIINGILHAAGLPPVTRSISPSLAYMAGATLECMYGLLGRKNEPPITRFVARQLSTAHWFDLSAAKRDLGYVPKISIQDGLKKLAEHFKQKSSQS